MNAPQHRGTIILKTAMNALMIFGERMTMLQLLGGSFILLAVWIVSSGPAIGRRNACRA
jgi:drug/metabolite transporter (DMT)-like permease